MARLAAGALLALLALAPAASADPAPIDVGHSAYVLNTVNGQAPRARPVVIRLNDKIVFEEEVAAGRQAKTTIEFRDGSLFSLGPDARARIDSFVFDPQRSTSHKTLAVTRGVFRYLSGFASRDQEAKINVPSGTLGIRGSLVIGVVAPGAPDFLFVAQGKAIFTNDGGSVELGAGQAIAIWSRHLRPMDPKTMPPAVAAQILRAILKVLPSSKTLLAESEGRTELLIAEGKANLLSAKLQERLERKRRGHGRHDRSAGDGVTAAELKLLVEAGKLGFFDGKRHHSHEQTLFLAKIGHGKGADEAYLSDLVKDAKALHHDNAERALRVVGRGVVLVTLIGAQNNPKATARLLQRAINALHVNTATAGHLVKLFAEAVVDTASCDPDEAKELLKGLDKVVKDPRNRDLLAYVPNAPGDVATEPESAPPSPPGAPNAPTPADGAFGSFGSSSGSGVSTSPAS
ncbi:MAG TPA: hypothetical protein VGR91_03540 [Stellaceae bacterium]|nr:hypothetical protein [Stellaceae bacterium]